MLWCLWQIDFNVWSYNPHSHRNDRILELDNFFKDPYQVGMCEVALAQTLIWNLFMELVAAQWKLAGLWCVNFPWSCYES